MRKKLLALVLCSTMAMSLLGGCGSDKKDTSSSGEASSQATEEDALANLVKATEGTVNLTLWCSETDAYQNVMKTIIDNFKSEYSDVDFNITVGSCSEADAKDNVTKDPEAAADVYVFADDQLSELVKAGALQSIDKSFTYDVNEACGEATVAAATQDDKLYAYPLTASNGYFLYYNSEYISDEDAGSWDTILEAANKAGKKVGLDFTSGWYTYGFFAGAGLELSLNDDGTNTCNWNATEGVEYTGAQVAEGIENITKNDAFVSMVDADAQTAAKEGDLVAYVSGTWDSGVFEESYGDGYSAAKLPTFTVNGDQVQMGSYAGYKLVGVNPLSANNSAGETNLFWSMVLAEYITNEASEAQIAEATGEGPANTAAAANVSSPALSALSAQAEFADLQRVGDAFWDPAASLGKSLAKGGSDVQKLLDDAVEGITQ